MNNTQPSDLIYKLMEEVKIYWSVHIAIGGILGHFFSHFLDMTKSDSNIHINIQIYLTCIITVFFLIMIGSIYLLGIIIFT